MALRDWVSRLRGRTPEPAEAPLTPPPGQPPVPTPPEGMPTLPPAAGPDILLPPLPPEPPPLTAPSPLARVGTEPAPAPPVPPDVEAELRPQDDEAALGEVEAREAAEDAATPGPAAPPPPPVAVTPAPAPAEEPARGGWLSRLKAGLSRSTTKLTDSVTSLFRKRRLDEEALEELEETLISADLGVAASRRIVEGFRKTRFGKEVTDEEVKARPRRGDRRVLGPVAQPMPLEVAHAPHVVMVVGVNGTGKTTTIGKLAPAAPRARAEGAARRGRHLPRRGHRAAADLGRAHRRRGHRAAAGRRRRRPRLRRAGAGAGRAARTC